MWLVDDLINHYLAKENRDETWAREDSAVQRRAADLEAAGLSKTLAAGSAATSTAVSMPEWKGGQIADALAAAMQTQQIKNARQENANMKTAQENTAADTEVKHASIGKMFAEQLLSEAQTQKLNSDIALNSVLGNMYAAQTDESKQRKQIYGVQAGKMAMESQNLYWQSMLNSLDYALASTTGARSTTGGIAPALAKIASTAARGGEHGKVFNISDMLKFYQVGR